MTKLGAKKALKGFHVKSGDDLVSLVVKIKPEVKAALEEVAKESRMDVSLMAGILLGTQIKKHKQLIKSIEEKVADSVEKEYNRLASLLLGKGKSGSSN